MVSRGKEAGAERTGRQQRQGRESQEKGVAGRLREARRSDGEEENWE